VITKEFKSCFAIFNLLGKILFPSDDLAGNKSHFSKKNTTQFLEKPFLLITIDCIFFRYEQKSVNIIVD